MRHKRIVVKYFLPQGSPSEQVFVAPPGRTYNEESLKEVVGKAIEMLDKNYPKWNFRMAKVGAMRVNFIYDGLREETCKT